MRFSIVIPAHNGERYLAEAVSSALAQKRQADEIIVIDDASTDRTAEIVRSPEFSGRVAYLFNDRPTGFVDAWNRAVVSASGEFVTILHQDDLLDPGYLACVEPALKRFPEVRHVYAACRYIDAGGNVVSEPAGPYSPEPVLYGGRDYARAYLAGVSANRHIHRCPGVTTSRNLLLEECTYRKEAGHIADDDFFIRVGGFTDVAGFSRPLASYRQHENSATSRLDLLSLRLARDYLFQVDWHRREGGLLAPADVEIIDRLAVRFVNLLLFQALLFDNVEWRMEALRLREELERLLPGYMGRMIPAWARPMWRLADRGGIMAGSYVRLLHEAIRGRDFFRALGR